MVETNANPCILAIATCAYMHSRCHRYTIACLFPVADPVGSAINNTDSVKILQWWKESGLELRCAVLRWWKDSRLRVSVLPAASRNRNIAINLTKSPGVWTPLCVGRF
ncbi:hypothetical protein DFJ73DRAFT_784681 [Zopfochytrium polystomum]|nr:hypothetical protein DFJ73DRAFT_784681 [Zopfochytrium polystomum]